MGAHSFREASRGVHAEEFPAWWRQLGSDLRGGEASVVESNPRFFAIHRDGSCCCIFGLSTSTLSSRPKALQRRSGEICFGSCPCVRQGQKQISPLRFAPVEMTGLGLQEEAGSYDD